MTVKTKDAERLMKRCQIGVGGRDALGTAHYIMADCYSTIGSLVQERDRLLSGSWNAAIEEAAKTAEAQMAEPECPERAQYCADAIRALISNP